MRNDTEKLEGENLILSDKNTRVKSRANDKLIPSIPYQQDQHVPSQIDELTLEEKDVQKRVAETFVQPRITRAMRKLAQDEQNKTKLKGETSSLVTGASNTSQDLQLEHSLS